MARTNLNTEKAKSESFMKMKTKDFDLRIWSNFLSFYQFW